MIIAAREHGIPLTLFNTLSEDYADYANRGRHIRWEQYADGMLTGQVTSPEG